MLMLPKEFYTTGEAAELLRISRSTISRKFDRGGISGKKNPITGERLVARESLITFLKEHNLPIEALIIEKKRVLVVTTDDGFFFLIQKIFGEDNRVKAERESYGRDVLARCSKGKLNLLVIDEKFPDISSADLVRALRGQEEQKGLRSVRRRMIVNNVIYRRYLADHEDCIRCPLKNRCIMGNRIMGRNLSVPIAVTPGNLIKEMAEKVDSDKGRSIYHQRIAIAEPVFANIKYGKRLDRFTLRGKIKVNIQWVLYCMVHNIGKILTFGFT
jgi:excisionase family DNA binding protein